MFWLFGIIVFFVALYFSYTVAAPIAATVVGFYTAGVILVEFATATAWVFRGPAATIDHLSIEPPAPSSDPDAAARRDPAYRNYFFGPVLQDYWLALQKAGERAWERTFVGSPVGDGESRKRNSIAYWIIDTWSAIGNRFYLGPELSGPIKILASGPMVGALVGVGLGALGAAVVAALTSVIFGLLLALTVLVTIVFAGLLRCVELVILQIRGITLECGNCHRRVVLPAYSCPQCPPGQPSLHRRLIPGSLGVFSHICRCGNPLPTLLAKGKSGLPAYCQHEGCGQPLPTKGLTAPTFHVPVVAGRSAGKTVFMMAAVTSLESSEDTASAGFEFASAKAERAYRRMRSALEEASFSTITATLPEISVEAFTIYVGPEGSPRRRLLYLYDAAGERYETSAGVATFRFLGHTKGIVFIVDPFSFPSVRRSVGPDLLATLRASEADTDEGFSRFAQASRENLQVRTTRKMPIPVAVVLTKCDALLDSEAVAHPYDELGDADNDQRQRGTRSKAVRHWLDSVAGQRGLVTVLENTFERCSYFAVSALDALSVQTRTSGRTSTVVSNDNTAAPILWLLDRGAQT